MTNTNEMANINEIANTKSPLMFALRCLTNKTNSKLTEKNDQTIMVAREWTRAGSEQRTGARPGVGARHANRQRGYK